MIEDVLVIKDILKRKYTLSELAKEAGIDSITLASRLNRGCPLNVALLIPDNLHLEYIGEDPDGTLHYTLYKHVFYGTTEDLLAYISQERLN